MRSSAGTRFAWPTQVGGLRALCSGRRQCSVCWSLQAWLHTIGFQRPVPWPMPPETQGLPELREAVAAVHYSSIQADQLIIAAPQELVLLTMQAKHCVGVCLRLWNACPTGQAAPQATNQDCVVFVQALLAPGDRVVCTVPGYQSLYEVAASLGCQVDPWPLRRQGPGLGREKLGARFKTSYVLPHLARVLLNLNRPTRLQLARRLAGLPSGGCPCPHWRPPPAQAGGGQLATQPLGALRTARCAAACCDLLS